MPRAGAPRGSWDSGEVKVRPGDGAGAYDCFTKKDVFESRHAASRRREWLPCRGRGRPRRRDSGEVKGSPGGAPGPTIVLLRPGSTAGTRVPTI